MDFPGFVCETRNHRAVRLTHPLDGSRVGEGLVVADLYHDGKFIRTAVVADCRTHNEAQRWVDNLQKEKNNGK